MTTPNIINVRDKESQFSDEYQITFGRFKESISFEKGTNTFKVVDSDCDNSYPGSITILIEDIEFMIDALKALKQLTA